MRQGERIYVHGVLAVLLPVVMFMLTQLWSITSSRCTDTRCNAIDGRLRGLESTVPKEIPPGWFIKQVEKLEDRIRDLETAPGRR